MLTTFQKSVLVTLAASGLLVALVLAARGPALAASPAINVVANGQIAPGIVTTGDATVKVKPDIAILTIGAIAQGASAQDAQAGVAERVATILARAKGLGIADKDTSNAGYRIEPQYTYGPGKAPTISGYQATQQIAFTLRDVDGAGKALDALVQGDAANNVSIRFTLEDPKAAQANGRSLAIADARMKADAMATAAGVHVGRVIAVSDVATAQPQSVFSVADRALGQAAPAPTQIPVGDLDVIVHVQVQFEIQ